MTGHAVHEPAGEGEIEPRTPRDILPLDAVQHTMYVSGLVSVIFFSDKFPGLGTDDVRQRELAGWSIRSSVYKGQLCWFSCGLS